MNFDIRVLVTGIGDAPMPDRFKPVYRMN